MELQDTVALMSSTDYQERFLAEYYQVKIRYEKLSKMVENLKNGTLAFAPSPITVFQKQLSAMKYYINILEQRAKIESIDLQ